MKVHQDHIKRILDAKQITYREVDLGDPHQHNEKHFMQQTLRLSEDDLVALPPQIFKGQSYKGVCTLDIINKVTYRNSIPER